MTLTEGAKAPGFSGIDQNGNLVSLDQFRRNTVILFFFPQDCFTACSGGCDLNDNFRNWINKGFKIITVCNNNYEEHRNYILQHSLPFVLIDDFEKRISSKYGIWDAAENRESLLHATFIISPDGIIEKIIINVSKDELSMQINFLKKLNLEYLN